MPQKPIQTLADALAFLHWDPRRHGTLLCIAPEKTPLLLPIPSRETLGALGAYETWLKQQTLLAQQKFGVPPVIVSYGRTFSGESDRRVFPPAHDLAQTWLGEREDDADRFLTRLQQALLKEQPALSVWWGGSNAWVVRWKAKQPIPLLYPYYDPNPSKEYETHWVVAPGKFTDKTPSTATVDLRTLSVPALLAGF
jgi:hypothetical protein